MIIFFNPNFISICQQILYNIKNLYMYDLNVHRIERQVFTLDIEILYCSFEVYYEVR